MWDQHDYRQRARENCRIIPTYVESTTAFRTLCCTLPNHSHVCGINLFETPSSFLSIESFPRMWDQRSLLDIWVMINRIIPTYVGSTDFSPLISTYLPNHSHVCGINVTVLINPPTWYESFPRMWDQPDHCANATICIRIIPTYVGSTCSVK